MAVTTSYPGIYIQELPSLNRSVTAAPTSVTVFIGYSHPFRTLKDDSGTPIFGTPVEIFSFGDYQDNFGGFFELNPSLPDYLGNAVFQFFENGGTDAWVVGLQTTGFVDANGDPVDATGKPTPGGQKITLSAAEIEFDMSPSASPNEVTVTLQAQQPGGVDPNNNYAASGTPTQVQFTNRRQSGQAAQGDYDIADIVITCGNTGEAYRNVAAKDIATALAESALVTVNVKVAADSSTSVPANFPDTSARPDKGQLAYAAGTLPPPNSTLLNPADYTEVFQAGQPLDVDVKIFNLMVLPGISPVSPQQINVLSEALAYCEQKRAFFIMDAPPNTTTSGVGPAPAGLGLPALPAGTPARVTMDDFWNDHAPQMSPPPVSPNGAIYFPYLQTVDQITLQPLISPPSGYIAGIFAQEDAAVSVGKAPAGLETTLLGTTGVVPWGRMTDMQQGVLNLDGVNCLREFPGLGPPVVFGARTLVSSNSAFQQWKYVPIRRTALFLEQSLYQSLGWVVFQENDTPLWNAITQEIEAFMLSLFRQGSYFQGSTPDQAFLVRCDSTTTTPTDQQNGVVNILVGFAPLKPAEFVVIQITQLAGQTQT
jgi:Bacteriophage tail sheath protein